MKALSINLLQHFWGESPPAEVVEIANYPQLKTTQAIEYPKDMDRFLRPIHDHYYCRPKK